MANKEPNILVRIWRFFFPKNWQYELMKGVEIGKERGKKIAEKRRRGKR